MSYVPFPEVTPAQNAAYERLRKQQAQKQLTELKAQAAKLGADPNVPDDWDDEEKLATLGNRVQVISTAKQYEEAKRLQKTEADAREKVVAQTVNDVLTDKKATPEEGIARLQARGIEPPQELLDRAASPTGGGIVGGVTQGALQAQGGMPARSAQPVKPMQPTQPPPPVGGAPMGSLAQAGANVNAAFNELDEAQANLTEEQQAALSEQQRLVETKEAIKTTKMQDYLKQKEAKELQRESERIEEQKRVDDLEREYVEDMETHRQMKVDPGRKMRGWKTNLLAGLAVALGEFGRSLTGGTQNLAMNTINKIIDDDIAAQEAEIGQAKTDLDLKENLLARMLKKYGNKEEAYLATQHALLGDFQDALGLVDQQYVGAEKKMAIEGLKAGLAQQQIDKFREAQTKRYEITHQNIVDRNRLAMERERLGAPDKAAAANAAKLQQAKDAVSTLRQEFKRTGKLAIVSKRMPWSTPSGDYEEARDAFGILLASALGAGRESPEKVKMYKNMLPSANDTKGEAEEKFRNLDRFIKMREGSMFVAPEDEDVREGVE